MSAGWIAGLLVDQHRQLVLGDLCLSGAAHAAPQPVPDDELELYAVGWGVDNLGADGTRIAASVAMVLGSGEPRLLETLAMMASRAHPDARELLLRVSARMVERLSAHEPDGPRNLYVERWLEACRRELGISDVDEWRKRLLRHRWAARGERRITLAAAIRRRMSVEELESVGRRHLVF
jgi:hypothetical protein